MNRFLLAFILLLMLTPCLANAAVSVRVGEHDTYSRLVFEWESPAGFTMQTTPGQVTINFDKAEQLSGAGVISAFNITGIEQISTNPLQVKVAIPDGAKARAFGISNRVIVDITDAPGRARPSNLAASQKSPPPEKPKPAPAKIAQKPAPKPEKKTQPAPEEKVEEKTEKPAAEEAATTPAPEKQESTPGAEHAQATGGPEKAPDQTALTAVDEAAAAIMDAAEQTHKPDDHAQPTEPEIIAHPNLVAFSAADNFNMAVFEHGNRIFMIVDEGDSPVGDPQVSGKNSTYFLPVQNVEVADMKGYAVPALPGAIPRVEGGSLIWNVIISPDTEHMAQTHPNYSGSKNDRGRGGSLFWPLENAEDLYELTDPQTGERIIFVTVDDAQHYIGGPFEFVDFEILQSYAGLAVRPKVDDLQVQKAVGGIEIFREKGLALTSPLVMEQAWSEKEHTDKLAENPAADPLNKDKLFDFKRWSMGGIETLNQNRLIMMADIKSQSSADQIQNLVVLARMHLANGQGAEALGFLRIAEQEMPDLRQNPQFLALRGAAKAFDWKTSEAFRDLSMDALDDYEEARFWKAFVLADLGDWQQASEIMPDDFSVLRDYTPAIRYRVGPILAEIKLRDGELEKAEDIFAIMGKDKDTLNLDYNAHLQYLKGEAARQRGDIEETIELWKPLTTGPDDLFRAKAGLALARLLISENKLTPKDAIDNLERLRYAWRGDELEAQINYWLGRTYFEAGQHVKGLKILRNSIPLAAGTPLATRVAHDMTGLYTEYFKTDILDKATPQDAVAFYEEFIELLPSGEDGNLVMKRLAEHLVRADLLDRASELLKYQVEHRLEGDEAARTAVRLAAIRLLNQDTKGAFEALAVAENKLRELPSEIATPARFQEIALLRARALSRENRADQALALLEDIPQNADVKRLKADIAWQTGYWDNAATALQDIILDENITLTRPLTESQTQLILQRAVALNLGGDRIALANIREKYSEAMAQTKAAKKFEVVTRPRQNIGLADRNTMLSAVAEVDLFQEFLESYKTPQEPVN